MVALYGKICDGFFFVILAFGLMRFSIFVISGEVLTGRGSSDSSLVNDLESNLFLGFEGVSLFEIASIGIPSKV